MTITGLKILVFSYLLLFPYYLTAFLLQLMGHGRHMDQAVYYAGMAKVQLRLAREKGETTDIEEEN
jgi:hypothetical protein